MRSPSGGGKVASKYRHLVLVEIETDNPDLDRIKLQEDILALLSPLTTEDGMTVATVEDRLASSIHRHTP